MICPKCNKEIPDKLKFCIFCGEIMKNAEEIQLDCDAKKEKYYRAKENYDRLNKEFKTAKEEKKKSNSLVPSFVLLICTIVIAVIWYRTESTILFYVGLLFIVLTWTSFEKWNKKDNDIDKVPPELSAAREKMESSKVEYEDACRYYKQRVNRDEEHKNTTEPCS